MNHWINDIEITNFKSIRHQKIEGCKKINVFVGPPNVGKSNLLEALAVYNKLFANTKIEDFYSEIKDIRRIESQADVYYMGNNEEQIKICLRNRTLEFGTSSKRTKFSINKDGINTEITEHDLLFGSDLYENNSLLFYQFKNNNKFDVSKANPFQLSSPFGDNLFEVIINNRDIIKIVGELFDIYDLKVMLEKNENNLKVFKQIDDFSIFTIPFSLVADTLKRLIFYLTAIKTNKDKVILLEEPEAHCYEPYIMDITNALKQDENNNQFFIVTHSQYVISELLREQADRDQVNIYLVGLENGETKVKLLGHEDVGQIYRTDLNVFFNYTNLWDRN